MNALHFCAPRALLSLAGVALLGACGGVPWQQSGVDVEAACTALMAPVSASAIGLPSGGATIETATLLPGNGVTFTNPRPTTPAPPDGLIQPAAPQYCKVVGAIRPVDPNAQPIRFQVNLPSRWNGRSLQLGGAGFNGALVTATGLPPSARSDQPAPLARGFVTVGTDSGHQNSPAVPLHAFALNDEALANFAHAAYKKVRDVSVELMKRRYGREPQRLYFMGSSEGGREGLAMAQRYPQDFDGIFARVPVVGWTGLHAADVRFGITQMGEGWLSPSDVALVHKAVLAPCDAIDWRVDGVVGNPRACAARFDPDSLLCREAKTPVCLSALQVEALRTLHSPYEFSFALANGVRSYPGWPWGGEGASGTGPVGGYVNWLTGSARQALPVSASSSRAWLYGTGAMQYFVLRDGTADMTKFRPEDHAQRVGEISRLMDATDPDLSVFRARGGKLVMSEHMADYAQSPYAGIEYYRSVVAKMGQSAADDFLRLYTTPGADHLGIGAPVGIDMLDVLVQWVERGQAPLDLVQVALEPLPPFPVLASRPMCRWPATLRYRGHGEPQRASSYECARGDPG